MQRSYQLTQSHAFLQVDGDAETDKIHGTPTYQMSRSGACHDRCVTVMCSSNRRAESAGKRNLLKIRPNSEKLAHPRGFEPLASAFGGQRSIQLSYGCASRAVSRTVPCSLVLFAASRLQPFMDPCGRVGMMQTPFAEMRKSAHFKLVGERVWRELRFGPSLVRLQNPGASRSGTPVNSGELP